MIMTLMVTDFLAFAGVLIQYNVTDTAWYPGAALAKGLIQPLGNETAMHGRQRSLLGSLLCGSLVPELPTARQTLPRHYRYPQRLLPKSHTVWSGCKMEIDLEDEDPRFGMRSTADLSWKMVLDTYSCTECGRCTVYCPTVLTDKPLAHRALNLSIKDAVYEDMETLTGGDAEKKAELPDLVAPMVASAQIPFGPAQPVVHVSRSVRSSLRTCRVLFKCVSTKS